MNDLERGFYIGLVVGFSLMVIGEFIRLGIEISQEIYESKKKNASKNGLPNGKRKGKSV